MKYEVRLKALGYKEITVVRGIRHRKEEDCEIKSLWAKNKNLILEVMHNGISYKANITLTKHYENYISGVDRKVNNSKNRMILGREKSLYMLYDSKKIVLGNNIGEHEDFILIRDGNIKYVYMIQDDCTYEVGWEMPDEEFNRVLYQKLYIRSIVGNKMYFGDYLGDRYKFNCEKVDNKFTYDLVEVNE